MCGRYANSARAEEIALAFNVAESTIDLNAWQPAFSIAPRTRAPIVREHAGNDGAARELELARWGLFPSWAKESGPRPINARIETVATSGMFRSAFASARAVVPMTGYFEWTTGSDGGKDPHFIHQGGELLAAAGLYAPRQNENGDWVLTFTIITREAKDASGQVHDRMPAFLGPEAVDDWFDLTREKAETLDLLVETSNAVAAQLTTHRVGRGVNNVRTVDKYDPRVVDPIDDGVPAT